MTTTAWPLVQEGPTSSCLLVFFCLRLLHSEFEQLNSWMRSGQAVLQGLPVVVKEGGGCRASQKQMCLISNQQLISTLKHWNTTFTLTANEWPQTSVLDVSSAGVTNKSEHESRSIYWLKSILMSHNIDSSNCPWTSHFSVWFILNVLSLLVCVWHHQLKVTQKLADTAKWLNKSALVETRDLNKITLSLIPIQNKSTESIQWFVSCLQKAWAQL